MRNLWSKFKRWLVRKLGGVIPVQKIRVEYNVPSHTQPTEHCINEALLQMAKILYQNKSYVTLTSYNPIGDYTETKIVLYVLKDQED